MNEINIEPSIDLIIGPMFSGKSTELLRRLVIYKEIFSPEHVLYNEEMSPDIGMGLRRKDTKELMAVVTESYEPVQYLTIVDQIEEALNLAGLDLTDAEFQTNVYDRGNKMELIAKFPAHAQNRDGSCTTVCLSYKS